MGNSDDREGDPADSPEEVNEDGDGNPDNEPSLGWGVDGEKGNESGDDRELQDHARIPPKRRRKKLAKTVTVEDRGYGGRKIIRNLTEGQTVALAERIDPYGTVSYGMVVSLDQFNSRGPR